MSPAADAAADRIDGRQLRALLRLYLRLALRGRGMEVIGGRRRSPARTLVVGLLMQLLLGLVLGMMAGVSGDAFTAGLLVFGATFFMVGLALTAEAGDVLFNRSEGDVLGHRPVAPRTILAAKAASLLAHALLLSLSLNLAPALFALRTVGAKPWIPLVHVAGAVLMACCCAALVVVVHGALARFAGRDKLDEYAAWAQVGLAITFIVGYQLVPRLLQRLEGRSMEPIAAWLVPFPPAWAAGLEVLLATDAPAMVHAVLAGVGLVGTAALVVIALGRLSAAQVDDLATRPAPVPRARAATGADLASSRLLSWWLRDPVERASFRLAARYLARDREVRTRLYPQVAMAAILPVVFMLGAGSSAPAAMTGLSLVVLAMLPLSVLDVLVTSSHHAAAASFLAAPLAKSAALFHGARKAAIALVFLPTALGVVVVLAALVHDPRSTLPAMALIAPIVPPLSLAPAFAQAWLPLSRPPGIAASSRTLTVGLVVVAALSVVVGVGQVAAHFGHRWTFVAVETLLAIAVHVALRRRIGRHPIPQA